MMLLNDIERKELVRLARSASLKEDMERLLQQKHNPVMVNGRVDMDRVVVFLTEYNEFINHRPKPFRPITDKIMKL